MKYYFISIVLFLNGFALPVQAQSLTATEQQVVTYLTVQQSSQLKLLEKLVNHNSGTENIAGVYKVGEILKPEFEKLGFNTYWVNEPASLKRAGTLFAERHGKKGQRLLLIAHLDTVFPADSLLQKFTQQGQVATGPGILDDKGGLAVILYALQSLQAAHALDDTNITVAMMGDEEDSGKPISISRQPLVEKAKNNDIALDFESAVSRDTASIARRGIAKWELKTGGIEAHSSKIFQAGVGYGAIFEMSRILNALREQLSQEKYLTFSPGIILGGTAIQYDAQLSRGSAKGKMNVVAQNAFVQGEIRFISLEQLQAAQAKMLAITAQHLPGTSAAITFKAGIPGMPPTDANFNLLKQYSEVSQALGQGEVQPLDASLRGAGDISHIAAMMKANLVGLGPVGTGEHSDKETLDIASLLSQTQRAALLIYRLTHK